MAMTALEIKEAYSKLSEPEQVLAATLIAADRMAKSADYRARLDQRHDAIESGRKWSHETLLQLHDSLEKQGL